MNDRRESSAGDPADSAGPDCENSADRWGEPDVAGRVVGGSAPGSADWTPPPVGGQDGRPELTPIPDRIGNYEILSTIAHGGMGVVYRARQISLNRIVALKMVLSSAFASPASLQRFRCEAESTARL